jgi:multiple sugar transport system permease protein
LQLDNFAVLFRDGDAITVWNSLVVAGVSTVFAMLLGTSAAYSLARFRTGGDNLAIWFISQRMVPPIAIVFPVFLLYVWLGWVDSFLGLILLYTAFNMPYVIWMMRGYIEDIPLELEESALVDGCTRFAVLDTRQSGIGSNQPHRAPGCTATAGAAISELGAASQTRPRRRVTARTGAR